jgi:hypothetical protein
VDLLINPKSLVILRIDAFEESKNELFLSAAGGHL